MSDPSRDGIHLTKDYYKDFLPTDLQWTVTQVDRDFTLYDLFLIVHRADQMIPGIFVTMGMLEFNAFWDQIQLDRDLDDDNDVEYLELYWHPGYDIRTTKKTGKPTDQGPIAGLSDLFDQKNNHWEDPKIADLPNLMSFHGVGTGCPAACHDFHECGDDCPKDTGYGIEFTPINNLVHLPIRVSPKIDFFPPYVESDREFHRTEFQLTIEPTLWCFITSIFWELTFAGSNPNEVADHMEKINDSIEGAKEHFEKNSDDENGE